MKRIIIPIILTIGVLFTYSCNNVLEEEPIGGLAPEGFFASPSDVEIGINGGYSLLNYESSWGRKIPFSIILRGDMVTIGDLGSPARRQEVDQMNMSASNGMVSEFWPRGYQSIAILNYAIEGGEVLDSSDEVINPIIAEGRFLRAFMYYHFVRLFGEIPLIDFALADPDLASSIEQATEDEIYASIIDDLEYAKTWLPNIPRLKSRPGKGTAAAFLASVHLTRGDWQLAYDEAKYVIDESGAFGYALEGDFADLFDPSIVGASSEVLLEIDFNPNDASTNLSSLGGNNASTDYWASLTGVAGDERYDFGAGWSVAVPSMTVFEDWDSRDYRKSVSFDTTIMIGGEEVHYSEWETLAAVTVARPHIGKYYRSLGEAGINSSDIVSSTNGRDSDLDIPLMRYAQVLLIAAEALNEINIGPNAEAEGYINQIRSRARRELDDDAANDGTFPENVVSGLSVDDFRDLVLDERRLELAFEGHRWYDIKRRALGVEAFGPDGYEQHTFDPNKDYLFPKHQQDVDLNPNLDQNDNY